MEINNSPITFILLAIIQSILFGCDDNPQIGIEFEDGILTEFEYYESRKVKRRTELNNDSIRHGKSIQYYESGEKKSEDFYINGKLDSISYEYYISGKTLSSKGWLLAKPNGEWVEYYDSTYKQAVIGLYGDTLIVNWQPLKTYSVYGYSGKLKYNRTYDKFENLIEESGTSIVSTNVPKEIVQIGDTTSVQFYLATPYYVERSFWVKKYSPINKLLETVKCIIDKKHNAVFYNGVFDEAGTYRITGISKFFDQLTEKVKIDSTTVEITVVHDETQSI